jgi:Tol biopolymer transport system component
MPDTPRPGLYLLEDQGEDVQAIDPEFFTADGHCSYSPDLRWLLYDSYPISGYRNLYLYSLEYQHGRRLGGFYSDPRSDGDIRCDLHPRWSRSGQTITFDSTHEGYRGIYRSVQPAAGWNALGFDRHLDLNF